jgi:hypothetical protein
VERRLRKRGTTRGERCSFQHRYRAALVHHGVTDYSWEQLQREYELALRWVLHQGVILIGSLDMSHECGVLIAERTIERVARVSIRLATSKALA